MAEPQSLPGRTRRPRPRRAIKRLVIWYRRTGPVIRLVNTANSALGPLRLGQTRPSGTSAAKGPRLTIAVDGMGGDYAPGPIDQHPYRRTCGGGGAGQPSRLGRAGS